MRTQLSSERSAWLAGWLAGEKRKSYGCRSARNEMDLTIGWLKNLFRKVSLSMNSLSLNGTNKRDNERASEDITALSAVIFYYFI